MAEYMQYWRFGMKINILFRPKGSIQVYCLLFTRLMIVFFNTDLEVLYDFNSVYSSCGIYSRPGENYQNYDKLNMAR